MPRMSRYAFQPIDNTQIKTQPARGRLTKVSLNHFARAYARGTGVSGLIDSLPDLLAGTEFRKAIKALLAAQWQKKPIVWGLGAHVIKCGLNPVLIDLMERGFVTAIALNGAGAIHDFEIALAGSTSEEVESGLESGQFGMSEETAEWMNEAAMRCVTRGLGLGESFGAYIEEHAQQFPHRNVSLLGCAYRMKLPLTVHVAIGTDTTHNHPSADGTALGKGSLHDFRLFTSVIRELNEGGVYLNCGSAVILPEVFLKAVTLVRNLEFPLRNFSTINCDFLQHYRPRHNVLKRPTQGGGQGIALTGHHELMIPLLAAALIESGS